MSLLIFASQRHIIVVVVTVATSSSAYTTVARARARAPLFIYPSPSDLVVACHNRATLSLGPGAWFRLVGFEKVFLSCLGVWCGCPFEFSFGDQESFNQLNRPDVNSVVK